MATLSNGFRWIGVLDIPKSAQNEKDIFVD